MSCVLVPFHQEGGRTIELLRMSLSFAEFHPSFILPELHDPEHPLTVSGSWNSRKGSTTPPLPGGVVRWCLDRTVGHVAEGL